MSLLLTSYDYRPNDSILYTSFNQDHSSLAVGISDGFKVFNIDPFKKTYEREFSGGLGIVELLFRSNILVLVGGGSEPAWENNKVLIWDDNQKQAVGELIFKENVVGVKLRKSRIIICLEKQIQIFSFEKLQMTDRFDTSKNRRGVFAVTPFWQCVIAYPFKRGFVRVENVDTLNRTEIECTLGITEENKTIGSLCLSSDGKKLVVGFVKGKHVRVFDCKSGDMYREIVLSDYTTIFNCSFSKDASMICMSEEKGIVWVVHLEKNVKIKKKRDGSGEKSVISLGNSRNSFGPRNSICFKGPECPSVVSFGKSDETVLLMTSEGLFFELALQKRNGFLYELKEEKVINFISSI